MAAANNLRLTSTSASEDGSEFVHFTASMRLPMPPVWAANGSFGGAQGSGGLEGAKEVLAGWVMRYLPPLGLVLLTFDPQPKFAHPSAAFAADKSPFEPSATNSILTGSAPTGPDGEEQETIILKSLPMVEGSGFTLAQVNWKGMGWRPRVGQKIVGSPTLSTPSHISLLLHNLFNASIPASHIPKDTWHFDPDFPVPEAIQKRQQWAIPTIGSATKEAAAEALAEEAEAEAKEGAEGPETAEEAEVEEEVIKSLEEEEEEQWREKGWWRHNVTNEPLGGKEGKIEFTIIGLTIANSMISLTGSLLADPFAPRAASVPAQTVKHSLKKRSRAVSNASDASSSSSRSSSPEPLQAPPRIERATPAPGGDESDASSDESEESEAEEEEEQPKKKVKKEKAQ